jgi:transposase
MEDWVTIKNLKKRRPDLGARSIAKILGINRNTVKNALSKEKPPEYVRQPKTNPDIAPFVEYISERLIVKRFRGSRVLNEIRSKGYKGSESAFYRHISKIEEPVNRTFQLYETKPGEQGQFDWSPYTVTIKNILTRIIVFIYLLGFSRKRVYEASLSENQGSVFEAMENGFRETRGVPERVQVDNSRCFLDKCSKDDIRWNKRYLAFCGHYGFKPSRSLPGHPWSKGKVENPFDYLEDHFIKGNTFESFDDFQQRLKAFQNEVNERVHQTTRQTPDTLFESEKNALATLPETRYVNVKEQHRKVTSDGLISFGSNRYSVPWPFAKKEVWIRVSRGYYLEVYSSRNVLVAAHPLDPHKGKVIMDPEHYKTHAVERGNWTRLSQSFLQRFSSHEWFLEKLKTQKRINPAYHLTQILDIARFYGDGDMQEAFSTCLKYNLFTAMFVKGFLENHGKTALEPPLLPEPAFERPAHPSIKRPLTAYQMEAQS